MQVVQRTQYVARPIKTEEQYNEAMALIDELINSKPDTADMELLELVSILVHDYEHREFPVGNPEPIAAIKYQMDELGVTTTEMAELVGGRSRLSELLRGKRPLSIRQVKAISDRLDIPAEILLEIA